MSRRRASRTILAIMGPIGLLMLILLRLGNYAEASEAGEGGWSQAPAARLPLAQAGSYTVVLTNNNVEHRFYYGGRHFMTLIDDNGTFNFRPHPGCDVNGWGSSWYAQPFLPGAVLSHTTIHTAAGQTDGVHVEASGKVSRNPADSYGAWDAILDFEYEPGSRFVSGSGEYTISLAGPLTDLGEYLNLFKIASNYLYQVPLLNDGTADTGDMSRVVVTRADGSGFTWDLLSNPEHFPIEATNLLTINVIGNYNNVDTAEMGFVAIAPAFKPGLKVVLQAQSADVQMTFGGVYSLPLSRTFWADNVGLTPLIQETSTRTEFEFGIAFESAALERCLYLPVITKS